MQFSRQNLKRVIDEWVIDDSREQNLLPKSIKDRKETLDRLYKFIGDDELNLETAKNFYKTLETKWKPSGIKHEIKVLRAFLNFCVENEYISVNFAKKIKIPKVHTTPEPLISVQQAEECILKGFAPTLYDSVLHCRRKAIMQLACRLSLRSGLRGQELRTLKSKEIFFDDVNPRFLVHSKGGNTDTQSLPNDIKEELRQQATEEMLFPQLNMKRMNEGLRRGAKAVGIPENVKLDVHLLRKIFGTEMARSLSMSKVSRLMRHSSITITQKFYISYGLEELNNDLNIGHGLIRHTMPKKKVLEHFLVHDALKYFEHDNRFKISHEISKRGELILKASPIENGIFPETRKL